MPLKNILRGAAEEIEGGSKRARGRTSVLYFQRLDNGAWVWDNNFKKNYALSKSSSAVLAFKGPVSSVSI